MSRPDFFSTLRSSDHDFVAALRFLDDYAKFVYENGHHHQVNRSFVPRFDLEQHEDTYQLYGELPGFRREDVVIEANDDRNLQVSGSISRLHSQPAASNESQVAKDTEIPTAESGGDQPSSKLHKATTTNQENYLNARFGDVLDPNVNFVDAQGNTEAKPKDSGKTPQVRYFLSERHPCSFHRAFHFPTPIKKDQITATMQDGILCITAPRAPMPPPVKVQVRDDLAFYPGVLI